MSLTSVRPPKSGEKFVAVIEIHGKSTAAFQKKFDEFKKKLNDHLMEHFPGSVPTKGVVKLSSKKKSK